MLISSINALAGIFFVFWHVHVIDAFGRLIKRADTDSSPLFLCPKCKGYTGCTIPNHKYINTFFFFFSLKRFQCNFCGKKFYVSIK